MKIAYLLKKFPRLSETFVLNEILGQEDLKTDIHIFSRRKPDDEPRHPQFERLKAEVETLPYSKELNPWQEVFPGGAIRGDLIESIRSAMRELDGVEIGRFPALLAEAIHLRRRCVELGIDHVHVHFATDSAITAMLLRDLGGPTYSVTAHAKDIYRSTADPKLLSRVFERSAFIVTVCDANVRWLEKLVSPDALKQVRRLYNGIDLDVFVPATEPRAENEILSVGRLVEKKGFDVLLNALALLRDRNVDFHAIIAGQGEKQGELEQLAKELGLVECVEFTGPVDQGLVRRAMSKATLFCLPCVTGEDGNRDALPTVLLEALAVGLPCISTPVTGIPEILADGRAGIIVPERDVEATAKALQNLLGDRAAREQFAACGIAQARSLFDARTNADVLHGWFSETRQGVPI